MNEIIAAFMVGAALGTAISQVFRWHDLNRIAKYINENNCLLMHNMDIAEENQALLEELGKKQGIDWFQESEK